MNLDPKIAEMLGKLRGGDMSPLDSDELWAAGESAFDKMIEAGRALAEKSGDDRFGHLVDMMAQDRTAREVAYGAIALASGAAMSSYASGLQGYKRGVEEGVRLLAEELGIEASINMIDIDPDDPEAAKILEERGIDPSVLLGQGPSEAKLH